MKNSLALSVILTLAAVTAVRAQTLSVDKTTLSFTAQSNGASVSQTLNISGTAPSFSLVLSPSNSWLTVNPSVPSPTPSAVTVTANPTGLNPGTYNGTITVFGGSGTAPVVQVTLAVGNIGVNPQSVTFAYQQGGTVPPAATLTLTGQPTSFNTAAATTTGGAWLQSSPAAGTSPGNVQVSLNAAVVQALTVGTYNGTLTITPTSGSVLTPVVVPVTLNVTAAPTVTVSPATVNLNYQIGGANNTPQQTVALSATGTQAVTYLLSAAADPNPSGAVWVTTNPTGGTIPAGGSTPATIGYDATKNLPAGTWNGKVTVFTPGAAPAQQDVAVRLLVSSAPLLNVPGATLAFNYQVGGVLPAAQAVTATSTAVLPSSTTGQMTLTIAATTASGGTWLTVPAAGVTGTPFSVSVNPAGLAPGNYTGTITVTGAGAANPAQTIPVALTVANDPQIVATVNGCSALAQTCPVTFPVQIGQAAPAPQTVRVTSSTGATLNYTATAATTTCGNTWLVLAGAASGATEGPFTIGVNAAGIAAGSTCDGTVSIAAVNAVTGASAPNTPVSIPVKMYVSNSALISVTPGALNFTTQVSGATPAAQTITVTSTSPTENLNYVVTAATASGGSAWLLVGPLQGSTAVGSNVITVIAQPGILSPGTYTGTVTITASPAGGGTVANSPVTIPVTFTVTAGSMSVSPASLSFSQTVGGAVPAAQTIQVAATGQALNWSTAVATGGTGNWLTVSPASGTTPGTISVTANGSTLPPGTYIGSVTITSLTPFASGSPATVNVQLVVSPGTLASAPTSLTFTQVQNGPAPATQTLAITGTPGAIAYNVTTTATVGGWLSATPPSATTPGTVTVSVSGAGLAPGPYTGQVTITPVGGGTPVNVPVTLTIVAPQTLTVSPATLTFNHTIGNQAPAAQTAQLTASGGAAQFTATAATTSGGTWLSVTPASGTTPQSLSISINPQGLAAGSYTGTISIASTASLTPVAATISVNLSVITTVPPAITAVRSAASFSVGPVAAGQNIFMEGTNLGPATIVVAEPTANRYPTTLGETQVTFDGIPAPIIYVSATQTSVMAPYEIAGRPTTVIRVIFKGVQSQALSVNVTATAPGIYTANSSGTGPGAISNVFPTFAFNTAAPAPKGSIVSVYMTGEGSTSPPSPTGAVAPADGSGNFMTQLPVTASVGGVSARVLYAGSAPGIIYGVMQVNVEIPADAPGGNVPLVISVGGTPSQNGVTVWVQ